MNAVSQLAAAELEPVIDDAVPPLTFLTKDLSRRILGAALGKLSAVGRDGVGRGDAFEHAVAGLRAAIQVRRRHLERRDLHENRAG